MQIGVFTLSNDGGWAGSIRTLTIDAKVRLVPNDDRTHDKAALFPSEEEGRAQLVWNRRREGRIAPTCLNSKSFAKNFKIRWLLPMNSEVALFAVVRISPKARGSLPVGGVVTKPRTISVCAEVSYHHA